MVVRGDKLPLVLAARENCSEATEASEIITHGDWRSLIELYKR